MATASKIVKWFQYFNIRVLVLHVVFFQVPSVNSQTYKGDFPISMLPFCVDLPCALRPGHEIKITFSAVPSASSGGRLNIILLRECLGTESPFDLTLQFENRQLIRTTFHDGNWGDEESGGPFPFSLGVQCELLIEVQPNGFNVTGNGVPLWIFASSLSNISVLSLKATGKLTSISRVEFINKVHKGQPGNSYIIYPVPLGPQPVSHPSFPFWGYFPEGLQVGKTIRITGFFPNELERTTINLCENCLRGPVMLHLDLRFSYNTDYNKVVLNTIYDGSWGHEERGGRFPFRVREPFTMHIQVQQDTYEIEVNGILYWSFRHRLPFTQVTQITIERDLMKIWKIQYADANDAEGSEVSETLTSLCAERRTPLTEVLNASTESLTSVEVPTLSAKTQTPAETSTTSKEVVISSMEIPGSFQETLTPSAYVSTTSTETPASYEYTLIPFKESSTAFPTKVPAPFTEDPTTSSTETSIAPSEVLTLTNLTVPSLEVSLPSIEPATYSSEVSSVPSNIPNPSMRPFNSTPETNVLGKKSQISVAETPTGASSDFRIDCTSIHYVLLVTMTSCLMIV